MSVFLAATASAQTLYEGARLIPGDRSPVIERSAILASLEHTKWNFGDTCAILGISRPTLRRKIALYGIAAPGQE